MTPAMLPPRVIVESNELMDTNALWKTEDNIFLDLLFLFVYLFFLHEGFVFLTENLVLITKLSTWMEKINLKN